MGNVLLVCEWLIGPDSDLIHFFAPRTPSKNSSSAKNAQTLETIRITYPNFPRRKKSSNYAVGRDVWVHFCLSNFRLNILEQIIFKMSRIWEVWLNYVIVRMLSKIFENSFLKNAILEFWKASWSLSKYDFFENHKLRISQKIKKIVM